MMLTIAINDHKNEHWELLLPGVFRENRHGLTEMWVYVSHGPPALKNYQQIPLPVFTEWWE